MTDAAFAQTPEPPYYAVIFSSRHNGQDLDAYRAAAETMLAMAVQQPGFLGVESVRAEDGFGVTISYWDSLQAIAEWRAQADHTRVRERGRRDWYDAFRVRVAHVEQAYDWQHENV